MPININGNDISIVKINNVPIDKVNVNGNEVFPGTKDLTIEAKSIESRATGGAFYGMRADGVKGLFAVTGVGGTGSEAPSSANLDTTSNFGSGESLAVDAPSLVQRFNVKFVATGMQIQVGDLVGDLTHAYSAILVYTKGVGFGANVVVSTGSSADNFIELEGNGFQFRLRYTFSTGTPSAWSEYLTITEV